MEESIGEIMKLFKKLDHNLWTALVILVVSLIGFASSCFLISGEYQDIPFGFLLSGGIISLVHVISYFLALIDLRRGTATFTILSMGIRLVVLITSLLLIILMYYKWDIKLFNVFVFIGIYTLGIIVLCFSFVIRKEGKEENA